MSEDECIPLTLSTGSSVGRMRIGGYPPAGVQPKFSSNVQKYAGTFSLIDSEVSLFTSLDPFGADASRDILNYNNQILAESILIHAVVHERNLATIPSTPSFQLEANDVCKDEPSVASRSKLYGTPYIDNLPLVGDKFDQLAREGYKQWLQLDTPSPKVASDPGIFFWDPEWLHIFYRWDENKRLEFSFLIQQ